MGDGHRSLTARVISLLPISLAISRPAFCSIEFAWSNDFQRSYPRVNKHVDVAYQSMTSATAVGSTAIELGGQREPSVHALRNSNSGAPSLIIVGKLSMMARLYVPVRTYIGTTDSGCTRGGGAEPLGRIPKAARGGR